jgi:DNA-binding CsgD family transcriptional regulator
MARRLCGRPLLPARPLGRRRPVQPERVGDIPTAGHAGDARPIRPGAARDRARRVRLGSGPARPSRGGLCAPPDAAVRRLLWGPGGAGIWQGRLDDARVIVEQGSTCRPASRKSCGSGPCSPLACAPRPTGRAGPRPPHTRRGRDRPAGRDRAARPPAAAARPDRRVQAGGRRPSPAWRGRSHAAGGTVRPGPLGGHRRRLGGARPALPGRLRPLAAGGGAAHPARHAGSSHHCAAMRLPDRRAARGSATAARGRRPGPARTDQPGQAGSRRPGHTGAADRPARAHPREREVLTLLAEGRTNPQIAQALFISVKTAGIHVSNILAKLSVASRGEAAAIAHRGGFLDQP